MVHIQRLSTEEVERVMWDVFDLIKVWGVGFGLLLSRLSRKVR